MEKALDLRGDEIGMCTHKIIDKDSCVSTGHNIAAIR
jgi:hypothetical protein